MTATPTRRWLRLTPDRCLVVMLAMVGFLFLSERFRWFAFNERKGWTVLIAVTSVSAALVLVTLCFAASLIFRWRFQFSIRSMLVLVVVLAIPCSWLAVELRQAQEQRRAVEELRNVGMMVGYSDNSNQSTIWLNEPPPGPAWLGNLLGDDFFANVTEVTFVFGEDLTDAVLTRCAGLKQLQTLWLGATKHVGPRSPQELHRPRKRFLLNPQVTDLGLVKLKGLTNLQQFCLGGSSITDAGLESLAGLNGLQTLILSDNDLTDAGLVNLKALSHLKSLDLSETNVTDQGVRDLQHALPNCRIDH